MAMVGRENAVFVVPNFGGEPRQKGAEQAI
jgi:hypothetical protein